MNFLSFLLFACLISNPVFSSTKEEKDLFKLVETLLESPDAHTREEAMAKLSTVQSAIPVSLIRKGMKDISEYVKIRAVNCIGQELGPEYIEVYSEALMSSDLNLAVPAAQMLHSRTDRRILPLIKLAIRHESLEVRRWGILALFSMENLSGLSTRKDKISFSLVVEALHDENKDVWNMAYSILNARMMKQDPLALNFFKKLQQKQNRPKGDMSDNPKLKEMCAEFLVPNSKKDLKN